MWTYGAAQKGVQIQKGDTRQDKIQVQSIWSPNSQIESEQKNLHKGLKVDPMAKAVVSYLSEEYRL